MLSGVKDRLYFFLAYANMGLMSAVAALVYAARPQRGRRPRPVSTLSLMPSAACFVGGASVTGGAGTIGGALVGCFVIGILNNGMSMMGISADWQQTVKGLVILPPSPSTSCRSGKRNKHPVPLLRPWHPPRVHAFFSVRAGRRWALGA